MSLAARLLYNPFQNPVKSIHRCSIWGGWGVNVQLCQKLWSHPILQPELRFFISLWSFIYLFIYFTLKYRIGFAIHQHASPTGVHVFPILNSLPPPSPYHPSGSSQCTIPKLPVSCIKPGLLIHFLYDIIHVLMPFSQIIPLLPLQQSPKDCFIQGLTHHKHRNQNCNKKSSNKQKPRNK